MYDMSMLRATSTVRIIQVRVLRDLLLVLWTMWSWCYVIVLL